MALPHHTHSPRRYNETVTLLERCSSGTADGIPGSARLSCPLPGNPNLTAKEIRGGPSCNVAAGAFDADFATDSGAASAECQICCGRRGEQSWRANWSQVSVEEGR